MEEQNTAEPVLQEKSEPIATVAPTPQPVAVAATPTFDKYGWMKSLARYAAVWLAVFLILKFVIPSYDVKGASMEPTYAVSGDRVLTDHVFFKALGGPTRSDIVVLNMPKEEQQDPLIKRVIGLPGETVEVRSGVVYINDKALDEPYIKNKASYDYPATVLPKNCYFVLGDNRPVSLDSHRFGCVDESLILSRVLGRYPWHP